MASAQPHFYYSTDFEIMITDLTDMTEKGNRQHQDKSVVKRINS